MKTAEKSYREFYHLEENGGLGNEDIEIIACMEKYANSWFEKYQFEASVNQVLKREFEETIKQHLLENNEEWSKQCAEWMNKCEKLEEELENRKNYIKILERQLPGM